MSELHFNLFVCVIGLLLHFAMKWYEVRQVTKLGAWEYIKDTPAQQLVSVLSTTGAFAVAWSMDWLNPGMAFACGYMGNSIAENLANRFAK